MIVIISTSGKPTAGVAKKLEVVIPKEVGGSLNGRVSVAFAQVEFSRRRTQVGMRAVVNSDFFNNGSNGGGGFGSTRVLVREGTKWGLYSHY